MTHLEFNEIVDRRIARLRKTLVTKAAEYASDADRLHNFKAGAEITGQLPAQVLMGFALKHWISLNDLVNALANPFIGSDANNPEFRKRIDEKLGDAMTYLVLLEGVLEDYLK